MAHRSLLLSHLKKEPHTETRTRTFPDPPDPDQDHTRALPQGLGTKPFTCTTKVPPAVDMFGGREDGGDH